MSNKSRIFFAPWPKESHSGHAPLPNLGRARDVTGIRTTAVRQGDGYLINGSKIFITNAGVADYTTVVAYTDREKGHRGISLLVVPKGAEGFSVGKQEHKLGIRGSDTRELVFEDCWVPEANLLGEPGSGFYTLMKTFNYTRPLVGAQALGIAQGALDHAVAYVKEREQFKQRLSNFQGIQWMLAEMALKVELARTMVYRACSLIDQEPDSREIKKLASMAKWSASDAAMSVTHRRGAALGRLRLHPGVPLWSA